MRNPLEVEGGFEILDGLPQHPEVEPRR